MSEQCTRSHPHELMDCCCRHKTELVRLREIGQKMRDKILFYVRYVDGNDVDDTVDEWDHALRAADYSVGEEVK